MERFHRKSPKLQPLRVSVARWWLLPSMPYTVEGPLRIRTTSPIALYRGDLKFEKGADPT
jgi:hypothetical protein